MIALSDIQELVFTKKLLVVSQVVSVISTTVLIGIL